MGNQDSEGRGLLRHTLATLAYRGAKAVRGAPDGFGAMKIGETSRPPAAILAHLADLMEWALYLAQGTRGGRNSIPGEWQDEAQRFFAALGRLDEYIASDAAIACPAERLFQGPIADALTHVGQITLLRRIAGSPVRGENYFVADIETGRVGAEQAPPRREFD